MTVCEFYVGNKHASDKIAKGVKYCTRYKLHFGTDIGDQDKSLATHAISGSCQSNVEEWLKGSRKCLPFAIARM